MSGPVVLFTLEIEGTEAVSWKISRLQGMERVHAPSRHVVIARAFTGGEPADLKLEDLITKKAHLTWSSGMDSRTIDGVVEEVSRDAVDYEIVVVPRVALLADCVDHKVFLEKDAVAIATEVLQEHQIRLDAKVTRTLPKLAQCVQAFESDLSFVSRILADEGVAWFVSPDEEDVVVATDDANGYTVVATGMDVAESGGLVGERSVHGATVANRVVPDKVTLGDYNFETPLVELRASSGSGDLEAYDYPGRFATPTEGRTRAKLRLEELRARERVLTGETTARDVSAGSIVSLSGAVEGDWLVLQVAHEGHDTLDARDEDDAEHARRPYTARFVAIPKATPYRPDRIAPPRMEGVENAITTGPPSQDLHTDQYARVKAQLRWDRLGKKDDKSSTWVRTLQPPTSGGFMLPRVGWEVLLGFVGTSADAPVVLGRLPNGVAVPPEGLPKSKTMSGFGSLTTPGGGTKNMIRMDDAAGSEAFDVVASYDLNEKTENDKLVQIKGNEVDQVGVNRTHIVGKAHVLTVVGSQTHTVGASRDLTVSANMNVSAAAESITIGAARIFKVGGDSSIQCATLSRTIGGAKIESAIEHQTRAVTGASTIVVGGTWACIAGKHAGVSVGGVNNETIGGPKSVKTKKDYALTVKGNLRQTLASRKATGGSKIVDVCEASSTIEISGAAKIKGADVIVVASDKITVKADGLTITITSSSVKIDGKYDGSVGAVDDGDETYA